MLVGPESHLIPFFPKKKFCLLHRNQFFFFNSKSHSELLIYRLNFFSPLLPPVSKDQMYITTGLIDLEPIKSGSIIADCNYFLLLLSPLSKSQFNLPLSFSFLCAVKVLL